jgi:hypothetical protein
MILTLQDLRVRLSLKNQKKVFFLSSVCRAFAEELLLAGDLEAKVGVMLPFLQGS